MEVDEEKANSYIVVLYEPLGARWQTFIVFFVFNRVEFLRSNQFVALEEGRSVVDTESEYEASTKSAHTYI